MNTKENYQLTPCYYEWHLTDNKGKLIYNCVDPFGWGDCYDDAKSVKDLEDIFKDEREAETMAWNVGEWTPNDNGLMVSPKEFTDEAIHVMAKTLYDYYIAA